MKRVKLTKTTLKKLKDDLKRYDRYLPTLQIKKQLLQREVHRVRGEIGHLNDALLGQETSMDCWIALLGEEVGLAGLLETDEIITRSENIAGVEIPIFVELPVRPRPYDLLTTPLWLDRAVTQLLEMMHDTAKRLVVREQYHLLQQELRLTAQRVNLFEKVKIPETLAQVRSITLYLADQQAAAVGWARIAKKKIGVAL